MSSYHKAFLLKKYSRRGRGRRGQHELASLVGLVLSVCFFLVSFSALGQLQAYAAELPTEEIIKESLANRGENSRIYDRKGELLYVFKDPDRDRVYADFEEIPPTVIAALLAAEDKDFFLHEGIDYLGMVSGAYTTISSGGDTQVGGSTITQQLVKQTLLTNERTVDRKVREALVALVVEADYEKVEIIEYYLNSTNYGGRIVGIQTAAREYFGKSVADLTLNEAIYLIGLVQSPGSLSPIYANDPDQASVDSHARRDLIVDQVATNPRLLVYLESGGDLSVLATADRDLEANYPDLFRKAESKYTDKYFTNLKAEKFEFSQPEVELKAPHWVFYIRDLLTQEPYGYTIEELYSGGLQIHTTLDLGVQNLLEAKLREGVDAYGPRFGFENGGAVLAHPQTGEIIAMVGSKGYDLPNDVENERFDPEVNVTTADHTLGSSLKSFAWYLAFNTGDYKPWTKVEDKPQRFYGGGYRPKNYDGRYFGEMSVRKALLDSRNLPVLSVLYEIGDWQLPELMEKIGYKPDNSYGLAAVVGGVNENLLDHAAAHTGLANGGSVMQKLPVLRIESSSGKTLQSYEPTSIYELNRQSVAYVNDILGDKSYRAGNNAFKFVGGQKLAGKTGTSDGNRDTYYMGYGPNAVLGVWIGNNDNTRMTSRALGSSTALPIWNGMMRELLAQYPEYGEWGSY